MALVAICGRCGVGFSFGYFGGMMGCLWDEIRSNLILSECGHEISFT